MRIVTPAHEQGRHLRSQFTRRSALRQLIGAGAGAGFAPAALASGLVPERARANSGTEARTIMLIRHAEKPVGAGEPFGVSVVGEHDLESLTVRGWTRAGALVELFGPGPGPRRKGVIGPNSLVATDPGTAGSKRPLQTLTPLSERLGVGVTLVPVPAQKSHVKPIVDALLSRSHQGPALGAFQHRLIPSIADQLGNVSPKVPKTWPEDRYDLVWVFARRGDGTWRFVQVPQLLLAGDKTAEI